ncbi:hypothetical protein D9M72_605750 [compost metagenome]
MSPNFHVGTRRDPFVYAGVNGDNFLPDFLIKCQRRTVGAADFALGCMTFAKLVMPDWLRSAFASWHPMRV